jgi:hypothetical protein
MWDDWALSHELRGRHVRDIRYVVPDLAGRLGGNDGSAFPI